jgi:hypothetical protein
MPLAIRLYQADPFDREARSEERWELVKAKG